MRKTSVFVIGGFILAIGTIALIAEAWAGCPPGTRYNCVQGFNGKVVCSCS
jgi:hypothetical protein